MSVQFAVLASGSLGNATLVRSGGAGLLVDVGLGARAMARRLESVGSCWGHVGCVLLTHTHGDHVNDGAVRTLARFKIPFYCHEGHRAALDRFVGFGCLDALGLVRHYDDRPFLTATGQWVEPLELRHDGGPTFGFRIEAGPEKGRRLVAIGYLADTGCWTAKIADGLSDVDLLGVEFNHDVDMQRGWRRHPSLIARNLGDRGHLSNRQGAELVGAVLDRSGRGAVRHLVLLHLSRQCNDSAVALREARAAVRGTGRRITVHAASQDPAHPNLFIDAARRARV